MKTWLIDIYRSKNQLIIWLKTPEEDIRIKRPFCAELFIDDGTVLDKLKIRYRIAYKKTYFGKKKRLCAFEINRLNLFENIINRIEKKSKHRATLYNADVKPEQQFLYKNNLMPFSVVEYDGAGFVTIDDDMTPVLTKAVIDSRDDKVILNDKVLGSKDFVKEFKRIDPDVIIARNAFRLIPKIEEQLKKQNLESPFHRWDKTPIRYRGGKTFFSYGRTTFRDYAVRLHGRFLIDAASAVGDGCETDAIIELSQLSGTFFQQVASRSFGAVFQQALVRKMIEQDILVPYKEKPIEPAISMHDLVKADRVGHTFDPKQGFHKDVAEIDFSSMYPWIMFNRNISAETIVSDKGPFEQVPGLPFRISLAKKGLVPQAIKAILERRMKYKKNPTTINKARSAGLKWVLVSSYGYCRFREFKLGIASTHMAIGAFAREIIIEAARIAEERGFEVIHGIIDSMYIKKKGVTVEEVKELCSELEQLTGTPIESNGIFKWVVFLPSINDPLRPLPACYFGVFKHGDIKARGIEVRQKSAPAILRDFQYKILELISKCDTKKQIIEQIDNAKFIMSCYVKKLREFTAEQLSHNITISKTEYKHNIPQKIAVEALKKRGINIAAGMKISYLISSRGVKLADEYTGFPDINYYKKLFERALFVVYQPFGFKRDEFEDRLKNERQTIIKEFRPRVRHIYVYVRDMPNNKRGFSERVIRRRLEKSGWTVWRGGFLNATRFDELYPNVERKYKLLDQLLDKHKPGMKEQLQLMCHIHHGMPDFFCFRRGVFKFVECKLIYEQLSRMQKTCISHLQKMKFTVEVHKVVDHRTKAREAEVDVRSGNKIIIEKQAILRKYNKHKRK